MYHVLSESKNGNVGIKIERKLTEDDYELLIPYIEKLKQEIGSLRLLCDMTECESPNSHMILGDLVKQLHQCHEIPRVAVIGVPQSIEFATKSPPPFPNTTVKYFTSDQLDQAWHWIESD